MEETKVKHRIERNISIDFVRVIAILAVVMIHVSAQFVIYCNSGSAEFIVGSIFDAISRLGVPLFIMVSGYLMLDENKSVTFKKIFKKVLNTLLLLYFWSFVYVFSLNIITPLIQKQNINLVFALKEFLFAHYHLWFLFMIIGLYLITPILRTFVKKANANIVLYFIALSLVFKFSVPVLEILKNRYSILSVLYDYVNMFQFNLIGTYVTYYLTGWYILNVDFKKKFRVFIYILGIASILITIFSVQLFPKYQQIVFCDYGIFNYFYSVAIFMLLTRNKQPKTKFGLKVASLSKYSFGIYVIHVFVLYILHILLPYKKWILLYILVQWILSCVISFVVTYIISKIPLLKKSIRG